MRSLDPFLLDHVGLQVCQFLEALLSTFDHEIPRPLEGGVVLCLRVLYVVRLILLEQLVLEC